MRPSSATKFIPDDLLPEIKLRIESIRREMNAAGVDAVLLATNPNIYYTTLRIFRGYVYIPAEGEPVWFIIKPDIYSPEPYMVTIRKPEMIPAQLQSRGLKAPAALGIEMDALSYSDAMRLMQIFPDATPNNASRILAAARMVKTQWEVETIANDGMHQSEVYRRVTRCYKEDMTDLEFQIEIERVLRLEGCLGYTRTAGNLMEINMGSVIAGENADAPSPFEFSMGGAGTSPALPVGANGTTLKPGETVMIDMSGAFNGYQSDMTRVWRVGEIPEIAYKAHECSREILRACESHGKPGAPVADLYALAVKISDAHGLSDYFMGHKQQAKFIGHGVGIELNELPVVTPRSKTLLAENMVIALEPKFVIPEVGAVGVENTYVVTPDGLRPLTIFPEEIQEL